MAYRATGKQSGIVWDPAAKKPLARFTDGVAVVDDEKAAARLRKKGLKVEEIEDKKPGGKKSGKKEGGPDGEKTDDGGGAPDGGSDA